MAEEAHRARVVFAQRVILAAVSVWFVAALVAGALGIFETNGGPPAALGLFFCVPIAGFVLAWRGSPLVRQVLRSIPLWNLTVVHALRVVPATWFLIQAARGALPTGFAYPAGFGDIAAAVVAVPLAIALAKRPHDGRTSLFFLAWNTFGLLDLLTAISLGVLHSPSPIGLLQGSVSTKIMAELPTSLVPSFFVPLFALTHLLNFSRARETESHAHGAIAAS